MGAFLNVKGTVREVLRSDAPQRIERPTANRHTTIFMRFHFKAQNRTTMTFRMARDTLKTHQEGSAIPKSTREKSKSLQKARKMSFR
jgi:hypothetical protein